MRIGLDIDGVLACFVGGAIKRANELGIGEHFPATCKDVSDWSISERFVDVWQTIGDDADFWLKLKPLPFTTPLDFRVDCYVTSRRIASWVSAEWLLVNRFPKAEVISVKSPFEKIPIVKERGLDLFVDDHWETVREMRNEGINAVLYEAPYQRGHDVSGLPKIKHLSEVSNWVSENRKTI